MEGKKITIVKNQVCILIVLFYLLYNYSFVGLCYICLMIYF